MAPPALIFTVPPEDKHSRLPRPGMGASPDLSNRSNFSRQSGTSSKRRIAFDRTTLDNHSKKRHHDDEEAQHELPTHGRRHVLPEEPLEGPWERAKLEWKDPESWWGVDDCGRLLDVSASFGGKQTVHKWLLFLWMVATVIYVESTAGSPAFLGNLDHWALLVSMVYQTLSLGNAHFAPPQPGMASASVHPYVKVFWAIFEIAAHLQLMVTVLFWAIIFPIYDLPIGYDTFALHGLGLLAVWIDGMSLNRIPVRIKHYFLVLPVDVVYCLWTIVHAAAGMDNGQTTKQAGGGGEVPSDTDAIYLALDWENRTVQSVFLTIAILTFVAPLCFAVQYCFSLYSFPWIWNGSKSRKVIEFDMSRSMLSRSAAAPSTRRIPEAEPSPGAGGPPPKGSIRNISPLGKASGNLSETSRTSSRQQDSNRKLQAGRRASMPAAMARPTSPKPVRPGVRRVSSTGATSPTPAAAPRRASMTDTSARRPTSPTPRARSSSPTGPPKRASSATTSAKKANSTATPSRTSILTPQNSTIAATAASNASSTVHTKRTKKRGNRPILKRDLSHMDIA